VKISPNPFGPPDSIHLRASEGWLELGNHLEANEELEQITPEMRAHPAVLCLRYENYAKGKKWDGAAEIARALVKMRIYFHLIHSPYYLLKKNSTSNMCSPERGGVMSVGNM
jgi:putative SOS response-associated peptidase YedK